LSRSFVLVLSGLALGLAGCGGGGETSASSTTGSGTTIGSATTGGDGDAKGDPKAGEIIFVNEGCGGCHSLKDAGVIGNIDDAGSIGPDLDEVKPTHEQVVEAVTNGRGAMPAFEGDISPKDIEDVAAYVSSVAGQ
jgi:mono/diheme cytochrome c family protein